MVSVSVFFYLFRYPSTDQNSSTRKVLQNFRKPPNCTRWHKEPNQKGFPRNIQYRTMPKGPPFQFFRHCEAYFREKNFPKGPPSILLEFCDRMDAANPRGSPLSVFRDCETFFKFFSKISKVSS